MKVQSKLGVTIPVPYKVYTALLTQSGTDAPVATVLENTLGGTVVWSRLGIGSFRATLVGAFTLNKTVFYSDSRSGYTFWAGIIQASKDFTTDTIEFYTLDSVTGFNTDERLRNSFVEIRVYP